MELAQSTLSASFIDKGAKQLLLKLLARLEQGQLVLHDGSECHRFGKAGSDLHAELVVQDPAFYRRLLLGGSIAAGETWVEGLWTSPEPVALVRLLARNLPLLDALERRLGWLSFPFNKVRHWFNRNTLTGSRANIAAHYDLGNTLYQGFLDSHMQYSSAIYPSAEASLEQGQQAKLFDATLALRREPLSRQGLVALLARWPWMTLKVLLGIYWQALRLFIKRTPIFTHPESR